MEGPGENLERLALYQGTASAVPQKVVPQVGFSPCKPSQRLKANVEAHGGRHD